MQLNNKKFHITTLGCRVNIFESEWLAARLISLGAIQTHVLSGAEICILNTCSVTNRADAKSKNFLNRILKSPNLEISVVMGCFSQTNEKFFLDHKFDIVIGNKNKNKVVELIQNFSKPIVSIFDLQSEKEFDLFPFEKTISKTRAFIKIQDGCNYKCSYCIIPFSRGKQRSADKTFIFDSIVQNLKSGVNEIILTGVNTAGYGEKTGYVFTDLINDIDKMPGKFRVRISSLEPFQITKQMIEIITSNPSRWCQHLHICLQSADDKILHDMNRKYSFETFLNLITEIRSKNPLISITTDYIVGFPTESVTSWKTSIKNLKKIKFSNMHIFPYSDRLGTRSINLQKIVSDSEKKIRLQELKKMNIHFRKKYLNNFIGKSVNVLFEKSTDREVQHGHSEYFFEVFIRTDMCLENKIRQIQITKIVGNKVYGKL